MRKKFDDALFTLKRSVLEMAAYVEKSLADIPLFLETYDEQAGELMHDRNILIHQKEQTIEQTCHKLLIRQQPVASDFKFITSCLRIIVALRRINSQLMNIVDYSEQIQYALNKLEDTSVITMCENTQIMLSKSIDGFALKKVELAKEVIQFDQIIDKAFEEMKQEIVQGIRKDEMDGQFALEFLMIAKCFEKIGDGAVEIAAQVILIAQ